MYKPTVVYMKNKSLFAILANTYGLYLKTQCYHWNVTGETFIQLHKLFEKQYEELANATDLIAERIIMLGEKVPANFTSFSQVSHVKAGNVEFSPSEMLDDLINDHIFISNEIKTKIEEFESQSDFATVDMLIERISSHEKQIWFLKSLLA